MHLAGLLHLLVLLLRDFVGLEASLMHRQRLCRRMRLLHTLVSV